MKTYSVEAIAILLNVDNETVRRWTRSGKLKAHMKARKNGYIIEELDLLNFLDTHKKFKKFYEASNGSVEYDAYTERLKNELNRLTAERDALNDAIAKIKSLLGEP